jgi:hypothetical protein
MHRTCLAALPPCRLPAFELLFYNAHPDKWTRLIFTYHSSICQLMQPARLPVPPQLFGTRWASNSFSCPILCDILRLPGELRPLALRSFHCLASSQQSHESTSAGAASSKHSTTYGGLLKTQQPEDVVSTDAPSRIKKLETVGTLLKYTLERSTDEENQRPRPLRSTLLQRRRKRLEETSSDGAVFTSSTLSNVKDKASQGEVGICSLKFVQSLWLTGIDSSCQ